MNMTNDMAENNSTDHNATCFNGAIFLRTFLDGVMDETPADSTTRGFSVKEMHEAVAAGRSKSREILLTLSPLIAHTPANRALLIIYLSTTSCNMSYRIYG
jgi:hypothetical protein